MALVDFGGESKYQPKGTTAAKKVTEELPWVDPATQFTAQGPVGPSYSAPRPPSFSGSAGTTANQPMQSFGTALPPPPPPPPAPTYGPSNQQLGAPTPAAPPPPPPTPATIFSAPMQYLQKQAQPVAQQYVSSSIGSAMVGGRPNPVGPGVAQAALAPQLNRPTYSPEGGMVDFGAGAVKPLTLSEMISMGGESPARLAQDSINSQIAQAGRTPMAGALGPPEELGPSDRQLFDLNAASASRRVMSQPGVGLWGRQSQLDDELAGLRQQYGISEPSTISKVGGAIDRATKPFDFLAELGADATPIALREHPMFRPFTAGAEIANRVTGRGPDIPTSQQAAQNTVNTLRDPRQAVEDFRSRPLHEQLAAGAIFDPTNVIPGIGLAGQLPDLGIRAGARVLGRGAVGGIRSGSQSVDNVVGGALRSAGEAFSNSTAGRMLADETGAVDLGVISDLGRAGRTGIERVTGEAMKPRIVARGTGAGIGGGIGYAQTDDDASFSEKLRNTLIGGAAGAMAPEITATTARAAGVPQRIAGAVTGGSLTVGRGISNDVMRLPDFNDTPTDFLVLKETSGVESMPIASRIKTSTKNVLANVEPEIRRTITDNPQLKVIADIDAHNQGRIENSAGFFGSMMSNARRGAGIEFDDAGSMVVNGRRLPTFNPETGEQVIRKIGDSEVPLDGATISEVREALEKFPNIYDAYLTPEQIDIVKSADHIFDSIRSLRASVGLPEFDDKIGGYFSRGRVKDPNKADVRSVGRRDFPEGREPYSSRRREAPYPSALIADGKAKYPDMETALYEYLTENLKEINAAWVTKQVGDIVMPDGNTVAAARNLKAEDVLKNVKSEARELSKERRQILMKIEKIRSQQYLNNRSLEANANKLNRLIDQIAANNPEDRVAELTEAINVVRNTASGALGQSLVAFRQGIKAGMQDQAAREAMRGHRRTVVAAAQEVEDLLRLVEKIENGTLDPADYPKLENAGRTLQSAWSAAMRLRKQSLNRMVKMAEQAGVAEIDAERVAEAKLAVEAFKQDYGSLARSIRTNLDEIRKLSSQRAREAQRSGRLGERISTTYKATEQQGAKATKLEERLNALLPQLGELNEALGVKQEIAAQAKRDIAIAQQIADMRSGVDWSTGQVQVKGLDKYPLPAEWADYINQRWAGAQRNKGIGEIKPANMFIIGVNNLFRAIGATFDVATYGTVGLLRAADNSGSAAHNFIHGVRSMGDGGDVHYMQRILDLDVAAKSEGLPGVHSLMRSLDLGTPETMTPRGQIKKELSLPEKAANIPGFKHANQFFDATTNLERLEAAYENLRNIRAMGGDPHSLESIVQSSTAAMQITGRSRSGLLPMADSNSQLQGFTFFAGKFTRSLFEVLTNAALSGGLEGDVARRALLRLGGVAAGAAYLASEAAGNVWDPERPFNATVGDINIDFAGPWGTLYNRASKGGAAAMEGDWGGAWDELQTYFQGKLAPLLNMAFRAAGVDFGSFEVPTPMEAWKEKDWQYFLNFFPAPFSVRDFVEQFPNRDFSDPNDWMKMLFGSAVNLLGIKNNPVSPHQKYGMEMDEAYQEYEPVFYERKEDWTAKDDPLFRAQYGKDNEKPDPFNKDSEKLQYEKQLSLDKYTEWDRQLLAGEITIDDWLKNIHIRQAEYAEAIKDIVAGFGNDGAREGTPAHWVATYYALFDQAKTDLPNRPEGNKLGDIDWDVFRELEAEWKESLGEDGDVAVQYIRELGMANKSPIYQERSRAMHRLADGGYFDHTKLPKYVGLESDEGVVRDIITQINNAGAVPENVSGKGIEEKAAWWLLERWDESPIAGLKEGMSEDQIKTLYQDIVKAYRADQAAEYMRSEGKVPKEGTVSYSGLPYLNPEHFKFVVEHEDDLKWFRPGYYTEIFREEDEPEP